MLDVVRATRVTVRHNVPMRQSCKKNIQHNNLSQDIILTETCTHVMSAGALNP